LGRGNAGRGASTPATRNSTASGSGELTWGLNGPGISGSGTRGFDGWRFDGEGANGADADGWGAIGLGPRFPDLFSPPLDKLDPRSQPARLGLRSRGVSMGMPVESPTRSPMVRDPDTPGTLNIAPQLRTDGSRQ
jgi:hypothetical protein